MKMLILFAILFSIKAANDEFKIYVFDVGQGDSQLIVYPSGYSILIDLGEEGEGDKHANAEYVGGRIEEILGRKEIDVLVLSHYHVDHQGTVGKGGIWYLIEKLGFSFNKFITRSIGTFDGDNRDDCNSDTISWSNIGQGWSGLTKWVCYACSTKDHTKLSKVREKAHRCNTTQIEPPDEGAEVEIVIRDAKGVRDNDGNRIEGDHRGEGYPPGENDYSVGLRIKYGDFIYSTCGDLSGVHFKRDDGFTYHNIETSIAPMMGEVDVYHVNHHGLPTSSNSKWMGALKPVVSIISCKTLVPTKDVLEKIVNVGSIIYSTNDCWDGNLHYPDDTIIYNDDIVVTVPKGSSTYTVSKKDGSKSKTYNIKKNKTPGKCEVLE